SNGVLVSDDGYKTIHNCENKIFFFHSTVQSRVALKARWRGDLYPKQVLNVENKYFSDTQIL
ncbi:hypothetical protein, partial [Vibrio cholerae]|uniref:hypothetical protein n=1 Tax=Vibrio cholerae TaxID=666 RepID=UPI002658EA38